MENGEEVHRRELSKQRGRRGRPVSQPEPGEHQPWKRWSGEASTDGREVSAHPYLARQMSDFGFRKPLRGSNSGVRTKNTLSPARSPYDSTA